MLFNRILMETYNWTCINNVSDNEFLLDENNSEIDIPISIQTAFQL